MPSRVKPTAAAAFSAALTTLAACTTPPTPAPTTDAVTAIDAKADASTAPVLTTLPGPPLLPWVRPRIGTGGSGNVFYGVSLPHGMIKLGPDTDNGPTAITQYLWNAKKIQGFSHTHLDGPGGSSYGYGHIAVMPTMGTLTADESQYASGFSHDGEVATPAQYGVTLTDHGIRAEVIATAHCGWHRYTFPAGTARIVVDFGHSRGESTGGSVVVNGGVITGKGEYTVHPFLTGLLPDTVPPTGLATVFAHVQVDQPPQASGVWQQRTLTAGLAAKGPQSGAWMQWQSAQAQTRNVKVCLSLLSEQMAATHAATELQDKTWQAVHDEAAAQWNTLLGRVRVTGSDVDKTRVYTALYHSLLQPADYTENGQFFNGGVAKPGAQSSDKRRFYTDDWCVWDTARTTHPLLTLLQPEVVGDMLQSMLWQAGPDGWLPKCSWMATGDSRVMTGNFTFSLFADALAKGIGNFDQVHALSVMTHGAMQDSVTPYDAGLCGYFNQGTPKHYVDSGWVPTECDSGQAASMTLEHAYSDWCLGQYAQRFSPATAETTALGAAMHKRGDNWRNTWNDGTGYPQARRADGTFVQPFDPAALPGFTEANAYIYQWFVPQDRCGLMAKMGGKAQFLKRLDDFFDKNQFDMGNEPDFHVPWMYSDAGRPDISSDRVHALLAKQFGDGPEGLPGNDDAGAMSAWFVFAALGLYPVAPGDPTYALTAPLFEDIEAVFGGRKVHIVAKGAPAKRHIVAAHWNGKALTAAEIGHAELIAGGELVLTLTDGPSNWATQGRCP